MNILKKILPLLFIIGLSYFAVAPFFISGFFPMHDDTQVQRVYEMKRALADGMFPVRWVPDLGYNYGYPIFNFYAPLAYYVGGLVMLLGFDALSATKVMIVMGIIFAGVSMYFLAREFWGERGALVSALLYVYAPYHALQIYVRGDVAEFWAYGFIPLAFLGVYKIAQTLSFRAKSRNLIPQRHESKTEVGDPSTRSSVGMTKWWWVVVGSLGYAGIILSHNLTAMMVTPFLFGFVIFLGLFQNTQNTQKVRVSETSDHQTVRQSDSQTIRQSGSPSVLSFLNLLSPLLIGILLASFYWLPTLMEMKYTDVLSVIGGGSDFRDHYVCPIQLWDSPWGFAGSAQGCIDGMSFKIGKLHILLTLFSLISLWMLIRKQKEVLPLSFFIASLVFSIFLMLDWSLFIWETLPKMDFFQFPWRFLILVSFLVSFLGGSVVWIFQQKVKKESILLWGVTSIICAGVIYVNINVFAPQTISPRTAEDYTNKKNLTWDTSKISDEYMPPGFTVPENESEIPIAKISADDSVRVVSITEKTQQVEAVIEAQQEAIVRLHIADFPAWNIFIDDEKVPFTAIKNGLQVIVPAGSHTLKAEFIQTPIENIANVVSLTGVLILILGIIRFNYKRSKHG